MRPRGSSEQAGVVFQGSAQYDCFNASRSERAVLCLRGAPERFPAKWIPVRVEKMRQIKNLVPVPIQSERKRL
jgi:hypothetical protein